MHTIAGTTACRQWNKHGMRYLTYTHAYTHTHTHTHTALILATAKLVIFLT
jgi:hypothetical protein